MKKFCEKIGWMKKAGIFALATLVCAGVGMTDAMVVYAQNTPGDGAETVTEAVIEIETEEVEEILATTEAVSGTWYDLSWSYSSGTLTIEYTGSMSSGYMLTPDTDAYSYTEAETREAVAAGYPWYAYRNSITKIVIGNKINNVSEVAFYNMSKLEEVVIGDDVSSIGDYAFGNCISVTDISMPEAAVRFCEGVLYNCTSLEEFSGFIEINGYFTYELAAYAFYNCTSLKTLNLTLYDHTYRIGDYAFYNCKSLEEFTIEECVEEIGDYAFANCTGLKGIVIPESVEDVGAYAFSGCTGLKEINISDTVTAIGNCAFMNCSLSKIQVNSNGDGLTYGSDVFKGNTSCKVYGYLVSSTEKYASTNNHTFVPIDTLAQPTFSALTNEPTGVHVYWDAVDYAFTYNVYRSSSANGTYSLIKSGLKTTDYIDVNTTPGSTYYYKVVAVGELVKSPLSVASKGITHVSVPGFKKIVNVVSGVHVYWNAADGAKSYNVYRSTNKASGYSLIKKGLTATHYIDTTAVSGTTYYYKVVAVNGTSTSADTEPFKAITYVGTPDITSRVNSAYGIRLGWDKINGATGYAIYRKPYNGSTWTRVTTISGNSTFTWTDASVKANNGTVYKYTIRALAGSDMKTLSGCRSTGRTMARLTSRTLNSAVKTSATSIKCNWTTTSVCNGYEVRFMIGSSVYKTFTVGNYKTGVKTFTGLKAGQTYKIQVRTYKKVEGVGTFYSAWSTAKTVSL